MSPDDDAEETELRDMDRGDDNDRSDPNAPLLPSDAAAVNSPSHGDVESSTGLDTDFSGGWFVWALTFSAGISGLLFGYDTGVISSMLVSIGSDLSNRPLNTLDKSLITSCTSLFALIASPLAGVLADKLGRRKVILAADTLFALGAFIQAVTNNVWAYIVGWMFSSVTGGWRWIVGLGIIPAVLQFAIVVFLPETPRWLVQAGFDTRAMDVLAKVYQEHPDCVQITKRIFRDIQQEVAEEEEELGHSSHDSRTKFQWAKNVLQTSRDLFLVGGNRRALTIAMMLQGLQQLCGFNSLMYFSATIFSILSFSSPTLTSLSVALTNFIFTLLAFSLIDRIGRRRILLYSIPVMTLSLLICAMIFSSLNIPRSSFGPQARTEEDAHSSLLPLGILLCLTVYTASYAFGLGNVPWQQSELFPLNVRSIGSALATATNWGSNFVVGLTFLPMMEFLSPGWTFAAYAVVCFVGWFGVWAIYPEMSGLSLEEVKGLLANGWGVRESLSRGRHNLQAA
ncbi:hypothetical protein HFD88_003390 [Aspergillus terreus]|nr:hypothetical protein HFD88_003390 [Aspergillus terreus]